MLIIKMQKQTLQLNDLHLRNLQIVSNVANTKRSYHGPKSNRTLMKLYLTKQILEQCLDTFDIFKEILQDPVQKNKLIRDVMKNIQLKLYDEDANIYNKGDISESIYMVIKGEVSLCLPVFKQSQDAKEAGEDDDRQIQFDYKEIDIFKEGVGFGEAQFIQNKKRGLVAKVKVDGTVVGCISAFGFEQIIELYRQRVYYKKIQMFSKCLLLKNLARYQLQFVVNNAKPITFAISKQIVSEGERPKALFLITSGQVELCRQQKHNDSKSKVTPRSISQQSNTNKMQIKKVIVGGLQEGEFLGDCELALNQNFNFSAICKSQKVKAYICDERIITSQLNAESLELIKQYFLQKQEYRSNKLDVYLDVKKKMQKKQIESQQITLSESQMKIKRQIMNRYVQKTPTLIGMMSPREIGKIVDRKYARFKTDSPQRSEETHFTLPNISRTPVKKLMRNEGALSPLLKRKKEKAIRKFSEPAEQEFGLNSIQNGTKIEQIKYFQVQRQEGENMRSETRPLLIFMRPFHKKVVSLHQRLAQEHINIKAHKKRQLDRIQKISNQHQLSVVEMRRMCQFISKIQMKRQKIN